jgi:hypothetical protein
MNEPRKPMSDDDVDQLLAQARLMRPETARGELAFETRLMARLRSERESIGLWSWRLVPWFAAVVLALGVFSWGPISDVATPTPGALADWILVQMLSAS